ncbi:hypothetical protein COCVIDRAFT_107853 [Bipolaris victoriae FI3]|uniref:Zn(2)-C6 fungal-type domain-containing protein n=1 Tax=Bipolaris victoriae (strain FI3) TaxID=930091 RepID=W7E6P8_BIPV3|nr:hypothetical protein COCVIDRAFT_107853 [Bipolaris victoriae FI3]
MVGVPGRSKGCVDCRKRKKGCDLVQPECGQCKGRGIKCGGYDSDRIFIYQQGTLSRAAALKTDKCATVKTSPTQPDLHDYQVVHHSKSTLAVQRCDVHPTPVNLILPQSLAKAAYSERTVAAFLEMYSPAGIIRNTNVDARELFNLLPLLSTRDEALQMATLAVGMTQLGITTGNESLTRHGRTLYGKALKETAMALRNPARANSKSLLIVPRIMGLFDMLYGAEPDSSNQAKSWLSHAEGELAMIISRGPEAFAADDAAHMFFTTARYRLLGPAIRARKPTIFDAPDWKTLPWKGRTKSYEDALMDIMCGIPELLWSVDKLQFTSLDTVEKEKLRLHTLSKCWTMHFQLESWKSADLDSIYTPAFVDLYTTISFPNIDIACLTVRYWLICLFVYSSLDIASGIDPADDYSLSHPDRPHPRPFARMITRSVDYFMQEKFGVTGLSAMWFPLGNTLFYMNRHRDADEAYITAVMKAWEKPKLPSAMREFLKSFRMTVDLRTLSARPLSEL